MDVSEHDYPFRSASSMGHLLPTDRRVSTDSRVMEGPVRGRCRTRLQFKFMLLAAIVIAAVLGIRAFVVQSFVIPSGSMENTLRVNDRVLVNKLSYRFGQIRRGEVIVFDGAGSFSVDYTHLTAGPVTGALGHRGLFPSRTTYYVKRVIGLPGDRVTCCDIGGRLTVNGTSLEEPYLFPGDSPSLLKFDIRVPDHRLWVMGDHRTNSQDSRAYMGQPGGGYIPENRVTGRAFLVVWPVEHWGTMASR
jgi:signal peptidase I